MSAERIPQSDKDLWHSLAPAPSVAPTAVSDMDFAAWLEGHLSEETAARIEAAVSADPILRQAALDLADILGKPLPAPPPRMAIRAQALVGFAAERQAPRAAWWARLLPDFGGGMQRGALAGMAVIVAAVGFVMGGGLGDSYTEGKYASVQAPTVSRPLGRDTTNDLNDLFTDNS